MGDADLSITRRALCVLVASGFVVLLLAGCGSPRSPAATVDIMHAHGIAYDPDADELLVATHHGLAKMDGKGDWAWVGGERFDLMGFTQDAQSYGTFYSSGHPDDPYAFGGVHLGLRRTIDGGKTWEQRSLRGEVDFHALTALKSGGGHIAGGWQGSLMVSEDGGATWATHPAPAPVYSLASSDGWLWAGTSTGLLRSSDFLAFEEVGDFPYVASLAVSPDGRNLLVGVANGKAGDTHRSVDGGETWHIVQDPALTSAAAVLFAFCPEMQGHAFAVTPGGRVSESMDAGGNWTVLLD